MHPLGLRASRPEKKYRSGLALACLSLRATLAVTLSSLTAVGAFAQTTSTWTSTSDTNFNNAANWSNGVPDATSATAVFDGAGTATPVLSNHINSGGLSFSGGNYTLSASGEYQIGMYGGISVSGTNTAQVISVATPFNRSATLSVAAGNQLTLSGLVWSGSNAVLTMSGAGNVVFSGTLNGVGLTQSGAGSTTISGGSNMLSSNTTVSAGTLYLTGGDNRLPTGRGLSISGGTVDLGGNSQGLSSLNMTGGTVTNGSLSGAVTSTSGIATVSAAVTGTGAVTKSGSGTLTLSNSSNTFTGGISVGTGTISVKSFGASGNAITLNTGGTLQYTGAAVTSSRLVSLSGNSTIDGSGTGPLVLTSSIGGGRGRVLTLTGNGSGNTLAGRLSDGATSGQTVTVIKSGTGSWKLGGNNTYTGATIVNGGILSINGSLNALSTVTVNSGGTLGGTGIINGTTTIASGGSLAPGDDGIGKLTLAGALTLQSGTTTTFQIAGADRGTTYDALDIRNVAPTLNGAVVFNFTALIANTTLDLFDFGINSPGGLFSSVTAMGLYSGGFDDAGNGVWTLARNGQLLTFDQRTGDLAFKAEASAAVPEPTTYAALAGLATMAIAVWRRRGEKADSA